jgi:hypothetical protein
MTGDLVAFLHARLDDDEQVARDAMGCEGETCSWTELRTSEAEREQAHNERWDPARVLAEVGAKRRIIAVYASWEVLARPGAGFAMEHAAETTRLALFEALRALALPFADHPDYREEWRP